jgi:alkanesulfonate monooxygenase SsuD/methylene tetrahydromethanopterin reductase-like flavin-dependent oxidoreductase (luciferase family)
VRFAMSIPPFTDPKTIVDMGVLAEESGWDAVLLWDHVQWDTHLELDVHDPWAMLSAMAVRTERVLLGTGVTPVSRRRPQTLAKQVVTLDHLSGGRAVLGVGLGEPSDADFGVFGDPEDYATRAAITDEALGVLDAMLRGEPVVHHGEHFDVEAKLRPASVQQPRPRVLIAGTHPRRKPLERALRWDGYLPIAYPSFLTPDDLAAFLDGVERPPGWEVWAARAPGHAAADFEAAGASWLVDGAWPEGDWVTELCDRIAAGPPR